MNGAPAPPLAGLRVVEVSSFVAAPLGGMTLAQLGAEVIRVDPVGGAADHSRWPITHTGDEPLLGRPQQGQAVPRARPAQSRRPRCRT
jgi:crotonobetainyl-CoA:carnitine CoA-transferase CaiB-like acyl-CoA transferase